ncbi:flagellar type III secretion system pore protein FliP [Aliarcobacter cryaerophilus]|uniref:flagellar type III secretion system pore protein FliP n=1 Tax=Aliarcobacter cryaerophilus TaxID=28198 RepID=UPI0021B1C7C8|nr:flagellar type III secretion system pore protein FliP [Aliarcobacter cryaerophilus]MCT7465621.1 flagellar type III secretion system pore protein FliP [Aliarcobacter cryaerophilus]MCT7480889.1 flagellar type III secretion system pore protein FliP [Aliarcobacter cryaerophilus]MCT7530554.1 flagellar type III secretion system pore protein FliP [Aliarcobacter cryaerophilus]MCT7534992.1 flagellar type III secretion system pore protein FliP [Aliarcobacter cryaerophilus]MCT7543324.1 flagellar type 
MKIIFSLVFSSLFLFAAQDPLPMINLSVAAVDQPIQFVKTINIAVILALMVLAPSLLLMVTSFTRIIIVLALLRQAMGLQQSPPTQIVISLALIMTIFIMEPYGKKAWDESIVPYMDEKISYQEAFTKGVAPFKEFMIKNTRESDLALFYRIKKEPNPKNIDEVSMIILMPSFIVSELRTAFEIGFLIFLPFLIIDIIVASILMSLGMMMLPPVMISLPIKIIFFIIVDGWLLIIGNLAQSFK